MGWKGKYDRLEFDNFIEGNKFRKPQIHEPNKKRTDYSREVNEYLEKLGIKDLTSRKIKPMLMYESKEKELIYDGISRDHEGRYKYLNERKKSIDLY